MQAKRSAPEPTPDWRQSQSSRDEVAGPAALNLVQLNLTEHDNSVSEIGSKRTPEATPQVTDSIIPNPDPKLRLKQIADLEHEAKTKDKVASILLDSTKISWKERFPAVLRPGPAQLSAGDLDFMCMPCVFPIGLIGAAVLGTVTDSALIGIGGFAAFTLTLWWLFKVGAGAYKYNHPINGWWARLTDEVKNMGAYSEASKAKRVSAKFCKDAGYGEAETERALVKLAESYQHKAARYRSDAQTVKSYHELEKTKSEPMVLSKTESELGI